MNEKLIIFGNGEIAELAHWYFSRQSDYEPVGFVVDGDYLESDQFLGLPNIALEDLETNFPAKDHTAFVAMGYRGMNTFRAEKFSHFKARGYTLASFVSEKATVLTEEPIGENCFIFEDNTLQPFVKIGDDVVMWSGNHIGHHSTVADHCFITSHVVVSGGVTVEESCFLGVNATIRDHVTIGEKCLIGAGAIILSDCDPEGVYALKETERARISSTRLRNI
jgi:sugar O-acyltransferase (sialic acid O-acetyltransferase NeuD family)